VPGATTTILYALQSIHVCHIEGSGIVYVVVFVIVIFIPYWVEPNCRGSNAAIQAKP
jgi:hypothetical protein